MNVRTERRRRAARRWVSRYQARRLANILLLGIILTASYALAFHGGTLSSNGLLRQGPDRTALSAKGHIEVAAALDQYPRSIRLLQHPLRKD